MPERRELSDPEKRILTVVKKLRQIAKLEAAVGEGKELDENQRHKVRTTGAAKTDGEESRDCFQLSFPTPAERWITVKNIGKRLQAVRELKTKMHRRFRLLVRSRGSQHEDWRAAHPLEP